MSLKINSWFDNAINDITINESLGYDLISSVTKIHDISRKSTWPVIARHVKASEELGELGTCVLVEQGLMPHKILKESSFGEAADTIICVLDVLVASWPQMSREDIIRSLTNSLADKSNKWESIVNQHEKLNELLNQESINDNS